MALRTALAYWSGSPAVRITMLMRDRKFWCAWKYMVGSTGSAYPRCRTLPTTPITRISVCPKSSALPIASSPGQNRFASSSFTIVTVGALALSPSVKSRPARSGVPSAAK
ncbi:hypothetical protein D3C83_50860 [compost metagenome]